MSSLGARLGSTKDGDPAELHLRAQDLERFGRGWFQSRLGPGRPGGGSPRTFGAPRSRSPQRVKAGSGMQEGIAQDDEHPDIDLENSQGERLLEQGL